MTVVTDVKTRWDRVAQRLRVELGEDLFTSWFARMELEEFEQGRLIVSVPTRFLKSWIETHYVSKLHKIGEAELGRFDSIHVRVRMRGGVPQRPAADEQAHHAPQAAAVPQPSAIAQAQAVAAAERGPHLDPSQTFDTFVVGSSNQLAHAAMCRVADAAPGAAVSFNPLFVHAGSGLGKTHLLSAVAHRVKEKRPDRRVMFLTAERFMINFVMALRQRDTLAFKDQFAAVDVLLIDDFQFLQGKTMQQEFCNAFNGLVDSRRQVIVAADVPPAQLDSIDQRMRSRLMGGLVVDIEMPDIETRRRILQSRYETMQKRDPSVIIPGEVLEFIANRVTGTGRELEGAMNRITAYQQFNNAAVTLDLASLVLRDMQASPDGTRIKIDDILKIVGRHFNVGRTDLLSPRRARSVVVPRQIGMYLAKKMTARSLPEIGRRFGGRDHSTVLHAVRKIEDQIKTDDGLAREVALLVRLVEQG
ncbi:MAG: chromosomal replication initiator protein DnaA [Aestuariivirga sp.]|uniref:chromosomal replication initiator protein DnaA n=1 Tax=Aestuariivirga sp. TaxID=2650926 RepID=UPI0025C23FBE|nr:chromosomal replication initiator protein DnaA [Aestuariivirga sp.]MCA3559569.1 chromosomal replication initiator protein DnaA [Aestuariivirga sp.]